MVLYASGSSAYEYATGMTAVASVAARASIFILEIKACV